MKSERNQMKGSAAVLLAVLLNFGPPAAGTATAQVCEIPLFVKQGLNGANVMIVADNSSSMNAALFSTAYDPNVVYPGVFTGTTTYYVAKTQSYAPSKFKTGWPSTPSAKLVQSDNGEDGRYSGNYLNWIYFTANDAQRASIPQQTRIQLLKALLTDLINRSARLRFGLTVFQNEKGGSIIGNCGVNPTSLKAQIAGITANTWTPLGETMETVLDYFSNNNPNAPIQVACQYNFIVVVTDGEPTKDLGVSAYLVDADGDGKDPGNCASIGSTLDNSYDCSDHFDDVAYYMAHRDLRPDMAGDQTVSTYVVGFDIDIPLLKEAAVNGDGLFFHASNAVELSQSLEYAIQDILRRISAGSAVAVVSTEQGADDRLYRGKFMPIDWDGFMECYALPYRDGDSAIWEAGELLRRRSTSSRNIFTGVGNSAFEFSVSNASRMRAAMLVATDAEAAALVDWGRGNPTAGLRDRRGWILGPIVHSTPVVVGAPPNFHVVEPYQSYFRANEHRRKMVYVGANDGMLHGFDAATGDEVWSFVPEFALPAFSVMADSFYCHKYSVDQTVTVEDVQLNGVWKTVLIGGGGEGGNAIYALDVTDPNSPQLLWQKYLPGGMKFTSEVEIATIAGTAMALVGSGLDTTNKEAWLHGYRIEDGNLMGSKMLSKNTAKLRNKATRPMTVDRDLDGQADLVYIADLLGDLYRFDVGGSGPSPSAWSMTKLYDGSVEITSNPTVSFGPNNAVYVYVGTGAYLEDSDMLTTTPQTFLCVFDRHTGSTATPGVLKNQTTSISAVGAAGGWFVNLTAKPGERITQPAAVVAETVIFTSFAPDMDACVSGGTSYLYQMRYGDGGTTDIQTTLSDRRTDLGQGVASYPVVDLSQGTVVVQSSDASISVEPIAAIIQRMTVRSWQENFDHVQRPHVLP